MRILKRIVVSPSNLNRVVTPAEVVPEKPDLSNYYDRLWDFNEIPRYNSILMSQRYERKMPVWLKYVIPKEIGYLVEFEGELLAIPLRCLRGFMEEHEVYRTERDSRYDLSAVLDTELIIYNNDDITEEGEVVFIYYTDTSVVEEVMLPIDTSFKIRALDNHSKVIHAKGKGQVYGLKLLNPELLPVIKGEIVHVTGYNTHN